MITFENLQNIHIQHELVTIRNYRDSDLDGLRAIFDSEFFTWFFTQYESCDDFVNEKLAEVAKKSLALLVIIDNKTKKIIGTSSLYEISFRHKRLEMGSSWLAKEYQGSGYNPLNKYLLIDHLINKLGFNRVQWKTDALNEKSKQAMLKLGFIHEGILRRHAITQSGRVRDSLVFAVTDQDWATVSLVMQKRIQSKMSDRS